MNRILVLIVFCTSLIFGQFKNVDIEKKFENEVLKEIKKVYAEKQKGKSNSEIKSVVKNKYVAIDTDLRILCRVRVANASARDKILSLGCQLKNESHNDLFVWIPFDRMENVAELNDVLSIGSKGIAIHKTEVISAGVGLHRTDLVYSTYGLTGSGVKVGVISDGINYWTASSANGDLPTFVYAVDNTNDTTNYPGSEGTAMMEIIHDIAPGAELWFGGINDDDTPLDFADRVSHLKQQGCKVVVDDIGWLIGYSYFQENEIYTTINQLIQNNGSYISACGNNNGQMYTGDNYTIDSDKFVKFNNSTIELTFTINETGNVPIALQWADDWFQPVEDFDLYVYDNFNQNVFSSVNRGSNFPPEEYGSINVTNAGSTYKIKVKWYDYNSALPNREIKVLIGSNNLNFPLASNNKQIFGHAISSEVISVAATNVSNPLTVENFSSRGPALVYSSGSGTISIVQQPKITGADAVETFIGQSGNFGNPFSGTSAAAPHLAGIAALYFEAFPTDGYSNFLSAVKNTAVTMNDGGSSTQWKNISGNGRADAFSAIQYRINLNFVTMTINQKNSTGNNVDSASIWQNNAWQIFQVPKPYILQKSSTQYFKSKQSIISGEKYHNWNGTLTDVTNHKNFTIPTQSGSYTANLFPTNNAQIRNFIEGSYDNYGTIGFKDPWLIDTSDSKGLKNRGTVTSAKWYDNLSSPYSLSTSSIYKGVFKNQNYTDPIKPYYKIRTTQTKSINFGGSIGTRTCYFLGWDATGASFQNSNLIETPVLFTASDAVVSANFKAHLLSNVTTGFSTCSQRKIVADSYNYLHMVYESMGSIWYSRSTNGGSTWTEEQRVNLAGTNAKCPSIACSNDGNDLIYICYQSNIDDAGFPTPSVFLAQYRLGSLRWRNIVNTISSYDYNTNPVVTALNGLVFVIYKPTSSSTLTGKEFAINTSYNVSATYNRGNVPNTNANSINPSLTVYSIGAKYYLAYQQGTTAVKYFGWGINSSYTAQDSAAISTGSGGSTALYPSISQNAGNIIVSWTGNVPSTTNCFIRRRPYGGNWSTFKQAGSFMNRTNNNTKTGTTEDAVIGWWDTYAGRTQFIKLISGVYTTTYTLPSQGEFQVSNGTAFSSMKAVVFNSGGSAPYIVNPLTYNFQTLSKENSNIDYVFGRKATITLDKTEISHGVEEIRLNGENILFKEFDTRKEVTSIEELNNIMQTDKFLLNKESKLQFSSFYYPVRSEVIDSEKKDKFSYNFQIELVSSDKDEPIGSFRNLQINKTSINDSGKVNISLDCSNVKEGEYYLRVIVKNLSDIKAEYNVSDIQYEKTDGLPKATAEELSITGGEVIKEYALTQNFPNPFNPSTIINYQIPKAGQVTLKIYDMLGKEVSTVVDEFKSEGKYSVEFIATGLSSGLYLYELRAGDFVTSKKMLLIK